jgi:putative hydrolase of the HAD superfamily
MPEKNRCLIFDADDTLWENNIYFEAAIEEFLSLISEFLAPSNTTASRRQAAVDLLNDIERASIPQFGYGSRHFVDSLRETFRRVFEGDAGRANGPGSQDSRRVQTAEYLRSIGEIGERLIRHPIEVSPEVLSTLAVLRSRHRLMLFTKGDFDEQFYKLDRSGLKEHFDRIEIVREKDTEAYHSLVERHSLERHSTFMIGNSPRSDVLPALEAGLWAVFVPHPHTWQHEHDEVEPHPRLLVAESLADVPSLVEQIFSLEA